MITVKTLRSLLEKLPEDAQIIGDWDQGSVTVKHGDKSGYITIDTLDSELSPEDDLYELADFGIEVKK